MQTYLRSLEAKLPSELKSALGDFSWSQRLHGVEQHGGRVKIPFFSDGMTFQQKAQVETLITSALRQEFPSVSDVLVFFERQHREEPKEEPANPESSPKRAAPEPLPKPKHIPGIKHVILVGSGKGGVGKSTVSANLAVGLAQLGYKVGILDGDVYGPNIPMMLGLRGAATNIENGKLVPPEGYGVRCMSMGLIAPEEVAIIWRGPMISKFIRQAFEDISWGELDYLVIDLPPGTGDTQISLAQKLIVSGAVVVTTPQNVALHDSQKAIGMFNKMQIPILGVVENMAAFICPHCGGESQIFGQGGGEAMAGRNHVPFLARIPLVGRIREAGDEGKPIAAQTASPVRQHFIDLAAQITALAEKSLVNRE